MSSSQALPPLDGPAPTSDRAPRDTQAPATDAEPDGGPVDDATGPLVEQSTGNPRVDEALALITELDGLPTGEHAAVYEEVDRRLHGALTELDEE